jgi:excisionase family DNA binding protein
MSDSLFQTTSHPLPTTEISVQNEPTRALAARSLLTAAEVADWVRIPKSSIYEYARRAQDPLPHLKVGRHLRFWRVEIEEWLERQR